MNCGNSETKIAKRYIVILWLNISSPILQHTKNISAPARTLVSLAAINKCTGVVVKIEAIFIKKKLIIEGR